MAAKSCGERGICCKLLGIAEIDKPQLLVSVGDRRIVVFPDQEADLGIIDPDRHKIDSGYAAKDGQQAAFTLVANDLHASAPA